MFTYATQWLFALVLTLALCGLTACAQPLCQRPRALQAVQSDSAPEAIDAAFWTALLLRGEAHDCCGHNTASAPVREAQHAASERRLPVYDVILSAPLAQDTSRRLVWLKVQRDKGFVTGPVALVAIKPRRVEVLAIGPLRLPEGDVDLQYVDLHTFYAIRADVTVCGLAGASRGCRKTMRMLPHVKGAFVAGLHKDADIELAATHILPPMGRRLWSRQIEQQVDVELCEGTLILTESAALKEYHTKRLAMPPRVVRQVEAIRSIRWELDGWQASDAPLWQMMAHAETQSRL